MSIFKNKVSNELFAPVTGKVVSLEKVPDAIFSSKMMGEGIAFEIYGDTIYSPCDGSVSVIAKTKHAIGITAKNGAEILIHVGLDTVNFLGEGFETYVKQGDKIKKGKPLMKIDLDFFKDKNVSLVTPMIITNSQSYNFQIVCKDEDHVVSGSAVIKFI